MNLKRRIEIPKHLTPRQVESVIRACSSARDKALMAVIYQCALRRGEVQYLRRRDWKPTESVNGILTVWRLKGKDGLTGEEHPFWKWTRNLLEAYLGERRDDCDALFVSRIGRPLGPQSVYELFRDMSAKAGIAPDLRHPHVFRHSLAVHHANMGTDIGDVQALLGHRALSSTTKYFKVTTPRKEDMVLRSGASSLFASVK